MTLFEQILHTNIINFLIVLSTLILIFKKAHLGDLIQKMADDVRLKVEKSSQDAQDALSEYKSTKKSMKDTPKLVESILEDAKNNAQNLKEKIEQSTEAKQQELKQNIEKILKNQEEKYRASTVNDIYGAVVEIAKNEVINRLDDNLHKKLINASIDELEKLEGGLL